MKHMSHLIILGILTVISGCLYFSPTVAGIDAATGLEAGVPSLPYYTLSKEGMIKLNNQMMAYDVPFTLADTFKTVYGTDLKDFNPLGYKQQVFTNMKQATYSFQKLLNSKNIPNADHYLLTSVDSARKDGLMLFAAVYRSVLKITVTDKYDRALTVTLTPEDIEFYRPYQTDIYGKPVDTVYEWAALPVNSYSRQNRQAVLLTLAADKVLEQKPKPEYWKKEKQWIAGDYKAVAVEQDQAYTEFLGLKQGFTGEFD